MQAFFHSVMILNYFFQSRQLESNLRRSTFFSWVVRTMTEHQCSRRSLVLASGLLFTEIIGVDTHTCVNILSAEPMFLF